MIFGIYNQLTLESSVYGGDIMQNRSSKTLYLTELALLLAIVIIMTVTNIGNIPIGPIVATIYQVPIIIGAVILGPKAGSFLGGAWGLLCFFLAAMGQTTDVVALMIVQHNIFAYLLIAFVPRLLTGLLAGLLFQFLKGRLSGKKDILVFGITGAVGAFCNTILYLGALYLFVRPLVANALNISQAVVGGIVLTTAFTNGLVEAALACILVTAICKALKAAKVFY